MCLTYACTSLSEMRGSTDDATMLLEWMTRWWREVKEQGSRERGSRSSPESFGTQCTFRIQTGHKLSAKGSPRFPWQKFERFGCCSDYIARELRSRSRRTVALYKLRHQSKSET